jgi:hypothetical protein
MFALLLWPSGHSTDAITNLIRTFSTPSKYVLEQILHRNHLNLPR